MSFNKHRIHGKEYDNCQWTGESITKFFKIPLPRKQQTFVAGKPTKTWGYCYGSASCAMAALKYKRENEWKDVSEEDFKVLNERLNASLERVQEYKDVKPEYQVVPAKSYTVLTAFDGQMTLDEFHALYDHDFQVLAYEQHLPKEETEDEDKKGTPSNAPRPWYITAIKQDENRKTPFQEPVPQVVPRCVAAFVDFMAEELCKGKDSAVMYFSHHNGKAEKKIVIGDLSAAFKYDVNRKATDLLESTGHPVYGDVIMLSKSAKLHIRKHKREAAEKVMQTMEGVVVPAPVVVEVPVPVPVEEESSSESSSEDEEDAALLEKLRTAVKPRARGTRKAKHEEEKKKEEKKEKKEVVVEKRKKEEKKEKKAEKKIEPEKKKKKVAEK
jgi:hypothetical protein